MYGWFNLIKVSEGWWSFGFVNWRFGVVGDGYGGIGGSFVFGDFGFVWGDWNIGKCGVCRIGWDLIVWIIGVFY